MSQKLVRENVFKKSIQMILTIMKNRKIPTSQLEETESLKVLTSGERNKISKITTSGDGTKYLGDNGVYTTVDVLTDDQKTKLSKIVIDGDGEGYLASDGTYKAGVALSTAQEETLSKIIIDGDGKKYLNNSGVYKALDMSDVSETTDRKIMTADERTKLSKIVDDGDGTKVLTDDGTYKPQSSVGVIDDANKTNHTTYSSEKLETEFETLETAINGKASSTHTHETLEEQAHTHDNKTVLDKINDTFYTKANKLVTNIIDPDNVGDGTKILHDDYKFKELDLSKVTDDAITAVKDAIGEHPIDVVKEGHLKIEEILDAATAKTVKELSLTHPIKIVTQAQYAALRDAGTIDIDTVYITTTEVIDDEGNRIDLTAMIRADGDGTEFLANDGTYKTINLDIDGEMSDSSENPVKNKVIKAYIDSKEVKLSGDTGNQIITKEDGIYVGLEPISAETDNMLERKTDGLYVKKVDASVSMEAGNAIVKKNDGLYVEELSISKDTGNIIEKKTDGLYATVAISADETNVLSAKSDGLHLGISTATNNALIKHTDGNLYVEDTLISAEDKNAIVEKEDGWYVEDKTEDIAKLRADVDPIKKYERFVNTELDYGYFTLSADQNNVTDIVLFDTKQSGSIEVNNGLVQLKAGKTYKISFRLYGGTAGANDSYYGLYNYTNSEFVSEKVPSFLAVSYPTTYNSQDGFEYIYTPDIDCEVCIKYKGGYSFNVIHYGSCYLLVEEIGRALTIDPVEHVNTQNGLEDTPVGHIIAHMGNKAPKHYLICDGAEYNILDYPYLAEHIKEEFGSYNYFGGDGEVTFCVPDLRERFLKGSETGGINEEAGLPNITGLAHAVMMDDGLTISYDGVFKDSALARKRSWTGTSGASAYDLNFNAANSADENAAAIYGKSNTVTPLNTSVLYCIKYEPTYYMNIFGLRTETVLFEGNWSSGTITLADSINNYDELQMFSVYCNINSYKVNQIDYNQSWSGVFTNLGSGDYSKSRIGFKFSDDKTVGITWNGGSNVIKKIIGIKYHSTTDGNAPSGNIYTDEEIQTSIEEIIDTLNN